MNQPAVGVLQVKMQYLYDGEKVENDYHVHHGSSTPWPIADIEDLLSVFENWEDTTASVARPSSAVLVNMIATDLTSLNALRTSRAVVPQIAGAIGTDSLPNNATIAVHFDTGNRGRGQSGRQFWIGLAEGQVNANTITTAARDAILNALAALRTAIETLDPAYRLVVVHRVVNGVRPSVAGTTNVLGFDMADLTIDSQYARLPNHKRRKRPA